MTMIEADANQPPEEYDLVVLGSVSAEVSITMESSTYNRHFAITPRPQKLKGGTCVVSAGMNPLSPVAELEKPMASSRGKRLNSIVFWSV